jgi:hypothetical protein
MVHSQLSRDKYRTFLAFHYISLYNTLDTDVTYAKEGIMIGSQDIPHTTERRVASTQISGATPGIGGELAELESEITLTKWYDPLLEQLGYPVDSEYVEYFWLPILGPSSIWLLRRTSDLLRHSTQHGAVVTSEEFGRSLGLGGMSGGRSLLAKTISRCVHFDVARLAGAGRIEVRNYLGPLSQRQLERLPPSLQATHRNHCHSRIETALISQRKRARQMGLSLLNLGEDIQGIRAQMRSWHFTEDLIEEVAVWLRDNHLKN